MPKLNVVFKIGICSGYGDVDFEIPGSFENIPNSLLSEYISTFQCIRDKLVYEKLKREEKNFNENFGKSNNNLGVEEVK